MMQALRNVGSWSGTTDTRNKGPETNRPSEPHKRQGRVGVRSPVLKLRGGGKDSSLFGMSRGGIS